MTDPLTDAAQAATQEDNMKHQLLALLETAQYFRERHEEALETHALENAYQRWEALNDQGRVTWVGISMPRRIMDVPNRNV